MEAKKWGRVIFCSSVAGFTGGEWLAPFAVIAGSDP